MKGRVNLNQIKNKTKITYFIMIACFVSLVLLIISVPDIVIKSIPAATSVKVNKLVHNDNVDVSGSIIKNARTGELWVQTFVSEKDISSVKLGQSAEITGEAFSDCVYTGEVTKISDAASKIQVGNSLKTMVEVEILIINPDERLKPGFTAKVKINTSEPKEMTIIPYDAVNQDNTGEYVYVLEDGTAVKKYIITGTELSSGVEVLSGINDNDTIITVDKEVKEGNTVRLNDLT